jgi:hypothetical protein
MGWGSELSTCWLVQARSKRDVAQSNQGGHFDQGIDHTDERLIRVESEDGYGNSDHPLTFRLEDISQPLTTSRSSSFLSGMCRGPLSRLMALRKLQL